MATVGSKRIVFYSWQSDLPNSCNRGFIQKALENTAGAITKDETIEVEPVVDRDTQGVPGAPDIASTIFSKITAADLFVADISVVTKTDKRSFSNPNVLIELGYAMKALGNENVILVFNRAFGTFEELPFDLRMRRILSYEMEAETKEKSAERKKLEAQLDVALRTAFQTTKPTTSSIPAIPAIENQQANRIIVLRRNLDEILKTLNHLEPKKHSQGGTADDLIKGLELTQEPVAEFSKIAEAASVMNDQEVVLEIYRWFGRLFERYDLPEDFSGRSSSADHDYFKFLGHELFVTLIAFLLREKRWGLLETTLAEPIPMRYSRRNYGPASVNWSFASEHLSLLLDESPKRQRMSLHADILKERHTAGGLAAIMPMEEFVSADYFLFLFGELPPDEAPEPFFSWRAWSALYLKHAPALLRDAEHKQIVQRLLKIFHIQTVEELRKRLVERAPRLKLLFNHGLWIDPMRGETFDKIGTR